jgi:hypothetical protein
MLSTIFQPEQTIEFVCSVNELSTAERCNLQSERRAIIITGRPSTPSRKINLGLIQKSVTRVNHSSAIPTAAQSLGGEKHTFKSHKYTKWSRRHVPPCFKCSVFSSHPNDNYECTYRQNCSNLEKRMKLCSSFQQPGSDEEE